MQKNSIVFCLLCLLLGVISTANASIFERLVMPGDVASAHAKYENDCDKCHESFEADQSLLCRDCHEAIDKDVKDNTGFHGKSKAVDSRICKNCHTDHKGRDADILGLDIETFDHKITDFNLKGQHKLIRCDSCHKQNKPGEKHIKFSDAVGKCYSCHKKDDVHKKELGKKCQKCHSEDAWRKMKFDHSKTDFSLKGKHKKTGCDSCHPDNKHKDTPTRCYACHAIHDAHKRRYGKKCFTCHSEKSWNKPHFDHDKKTKFKLKHKHQQVACDSCHTHKKGNIFNKKTHPKKNCYSCHKSDDIHRGQNGKKCQNCHSEKGWDKADFDHDEDTDFRLKGSHKELTCTACHPSGSLKDKKKRKKTRSECFSCHELDDPHKGQLGKKCDSCHDEDGWLQIANFNHDIVNFPLLGQHAIIPCEECHISNAFKDVKQACIACHKKDDSHKETMGADCGRCHNPNGWVFWGFEHNKETKFILDGAHEGLRCAACHKEKMTDEVELSSTCNVCHSRDDIHNGSFGSQCDKCHTTERFDENKMW